MCIKSKVQSLKTQRKKKATRGSLFKCLKNWKMSETREHQIMTLSGAKMSRAGPVCVVM